jgi:hypothetical protein
LLLFEIDCLNKNIFFIYLGLHISCGHWKKNQLCQWLQPFQSSNPYCNQKRPGNQIQ